MLGSVIASFKLPYTISVECFQSKRTLFNWFQTQHQDKITSVCASINMTKLSLQMYKLTLYFSSSCIYESGGGICLTRAWLVLGVGLLVGVFHLRIFCDNMGHYSLLLLYRHEVLFNICRVCESASTFMFSGAVWRPWPCSCSDHDSWVPSRRRLGPVWILMNKDANLRQMGTNFTL